MTTTEAQYDLADLTNLIGFVDRGNPHGVEPSGFRMALLKLLFVADADNRAKLRLAFPGQVDAVTLYQHGGIEALRIAIEARS